MKPLLITLLAWMASGLLSWGANPGDEVVVIYNTRVPESKDVADHYAAMRHVPENQVLGFDLPGSEAISRADFRERLQQPLLKELETRGLLHFDVQTTPATNNEPSHAGRKVMRASIRYLALCYGVPLMITRDTNLHEPDEDKLPAEVRLRNEAAVDSELACLPSLDQNMMLAGPRVNGLYSTTNAATLDPTNGILLVARLDGPTAAIARALVDKALEAETNGLWGRGYFDLRGVTNGPYALGDEWIGNAAKVCERMGFEVSVDTNSTTFPTSYPLSQVAFYAGWYDDDISGPFARPVVEFMPGAFAYHIQSFSAATLRSTHRHWVGPLLDRGATITMGAVDEPYLGGTPNIGIFLARLIYSRFSFGEAAYASQNFVSWQITVVGDPLYRPFGRSEEAVQEDLLQRHSKLVDWSYLRTADIKLASGVPMEQIIGALEKLPPAKTSAVLQEKLADLYFAYGKPSSAVFALQQVLRLDPSPQQQVRVTLELAQKLIPLGRVDEAYAVYQEFATQNPDYPDQLTIYRLLEDMAQMLDHKDDAVRYEHEITRLTTPISSLEKKPPVRKGI